MLLGEEVVISSDGRPDALQGLRPLDADRPVDQIIQLFRGCGVEASLYGGGNSAESSP